MLRRSYGRRGSGFLFLWPWSPVTKDCPTALPVWHGKPADDRRAYHGCSSTLRDDSELCLDPSEVGAHSELTETRAGALKRLLGAIHLARLTEQTPEA